MAKLLRGTVFANGYQGHASTETCPGHSTILTGSHPTNTGIIGNTWVDQSVSRSDKTVYCSEDERVAGSSTTFLLIALTMAISAVAPSRLARSTHSTRS